MTLKELLYPPRCPFCGKLMEREEPCEECLSRTTELTAAVCRVCGADPEHCKCGSRSFAFTRSVSAFHYEKAPRHLLLRFKLRHKPQLAEFMGRRMYHHIRARLGTDFSCVTYVPQTRSRTIKRGYCPARLLAENIAPRLGLSVHLFLKRVSNRQQKYAKGQNRWLNAEKNYTLRPGAVVSGRVLLIDDLLTSGATLSACAALLREAGAEEVVCATFAIAVKKY